MVTTNNIMATITNPLLVTGNSYPQIGQTREVSSTFIAHEGHSLFAIFKFINLAEIHKL
jgi:hypothetical protein